MNVVLRINSYSRVVVVHHGAYYNCEPTKIKDTEFGPIRSQGIGQILAKIHLIYRTPCVIQDVTL